MVSWCTFFIGCLLARKWLGNKQSPLSFGKLLTHNSIKDYSSVNTEITVARLYFRVQEISKICTYIYTKTRLCRDCSKRFAPILLMISLKSLITRNILHVGWQIYSIWLLRLPVTASVMLPILQLAEKDFSTPKHYFPITFLHASSFYSSCSDRELSILIHRTTVFLNWLKQNGTIYVWAFLNYSVSNGVDVAEPLDDAEAEQELLNRGHSLKFQFLFSWQSTCTWLRSLLQLTIADTCWWVMGAFTFISVMQWHHLNRSMYH